MATRSARFDRGVGAQRPRPAIAPSSRICRTTAASGARSSATADTCLGSECPQYQQCFVTRMRQRAAESDVVIVNHHLLCADAAVRQSSYGEVIPDCRHLVLDEAHQLEDVATQYFGLSVSNYRLDELRARRRAPAERGRRRRRRTAMRRRAVARVTDHARAFFGGVAMARRTRGTPARNACASDPDWFGDIVDRRPGARHGARRPRGGRWRWPAARPASRRRPRDQRGRADASRGAPARSATICGSCSRRRMPPTSTSSRRAAAASSCAPRRSTSRRSFRSSCSIACARRC